MKQEMPAQPGAMSPPREKTSGLAIASLVCGIAGFCTFGLSAPVGLITGIPALKDMQKSGGRLTGKGLAIAGIVLSIIGCLLLAACLLLGSLMVFRNELRVWTVHQWESAKEQSQPDTSDQFLH